MLFAVSNLPTRSGRPLSFPPSFVWTKFSIYPLPSQPLSPLSSTQFDAYTIKRERERERAASSIASTLHPSTLYTHTHKESSRIPLWSILAFDELDLSLSLSTCLLATLCCCCCCLGNKVKSSSSSSSSRSSSKTFNLFLPFPLIQTQSPEEWTIG